MKFFEMLTNKTLLPMDNDFKNSIDKSSHSQPYEKF